MRFLGGFEWCVVECFFEVFWIVVWDSVCFLNKRVAFWDDKATQLSPFQRLELDHWG